MVGPGTERRGAVFTALPGGVVVAVCLAGSRWGTYLHVGPVYIADVLLALTLGHVAVAVLLRRGTSHRRLRASVPLPLVGFATSVVIMAASSLGRDPILDWARDLAPYGYVVLALLSFKLWPSIDQEARARTRRLVELALLVHLAWCLVARATGILFVGIQVGGPFGLPLLLVRPDFDGAVLGITCAYFVWRRVSPCPGRLDVLLAAVAGFLALEFESRAALLSVAACLLLVGIVVIQRTRASRRAVATAMVVVLVVIASAAFVVPRSSSGQRLLASIGLAGQALSPALSDGRGTQQARLDTWTRIDAWSSAETARRYVGEGFGNNPVADAGASTLLEGTTHENVRSPHNWFVGTLARVGLLGVALLMVLVTRLLAGSARTMHEDPDDGLVVLAGLVVVGLLPVAILGVVMESPFGAIPFWWSAGIVLAHRRTPPGQQREPARSRVASGA